MDVLTDANWPAIVDAGSTVTLISLLGWTWRWIIGELRRERDYWRTMAITNLGLAEKGVRFAESANAKHDDAP